LQDLPSPSGLFSVGEKLYRLIRSPRARLGIRGKPQEVFNGLLPQDHLTLLNGPFPVRAEIYPAPPGSSPFRCVSFRIVNKGTKEKVESCSLSAAVGRGRLADIPIDCLWTIEGEREVTDIPARGHRDFVPFLISPSEEVVLFCSAVFPNYTPDTSTWQVKLPFHTQLCLEVTATAANAKTVGSRVLFRAKGRSLQDIVVEDVEKLR